MKTEGLEQAFRLGLQALDAIDRRKLNVRQPRRLVGSIALDSALADRFPNDNRWDYAVAHNGRNLTIHWIEIHPASGSGVIDEIRAKLDWLKSWLMNEGWRLGAIERRFVWIASGSCAFRQGSPQLRTLAKVGVHFAGKHYRIAG